MNRPEGRGAGAARGGGGREGDLGSHVSLELTVPLTCGEGFPGEKKNKRTSYEDKLACFDWKTKGRLVFHPNESLDFFMFAFVTTCLADGITPVVTHIKIFPFSDVKILGLFPLPTGL